jgi:hypothetical protein
MPNVHLADKSINEPTVMEQHPARTTPQGTQADGVLNGHEQRDVDFRALAGWFAGLAVVIFGTFFLMIVMFRFVMGDIEASGKAKTPFDTMPSRRTPSGPLIEGLTLGGEVNAGQRVHRLAYQNEQNAKLLAWGLAKRNTEGQPQPTIPDAIINRVATENPSGAASSQTAGLQETELQRMPSGWSGGRYHEDGTKVGSNAEAGSSK